MSTDVELLPAWPSATGAARARELFVRTYGREPAGVWSAPGRVNVIGEHVDYNAGPCLPLALPHRTFVAVGPGTGRRARVVSAQEDGGPRTIGLDDVGPVGTPGAVDGWLAYVVGTWWAMDRAQLLAEVPGFDVAVDSCVPYGAGLSSSAALEAAVAVGLEDLWPATHGLGGDAHRARIATACVRGENEIAGAPTGGMDQAAALRTTAGHVLLLDSRDGSVEHVPLDLEASGLALLVMDTRAPHRLVDGQYARRRQVCEEAATLLGVPSLREVADAHVLGEVDLDEVLSRLATEEQRRRVRHVVTEIDRVGFVAQRLRDAPVLGPWARTVVGRTLDDSHTSLRDDYEVSCRELDVAVEAARAAGAYGGRMTGGGFGGSAIALVDADAVIETAGHVAAAFAAAGLRAPAFLTAVASGPAGRADG